jgi:hypothetical protein
MAAAETATSVSGKSGYRPGFLISMTNLAGMARSWRAERRAA